MSYRPYANLTASGLSDTRENNTGVTITKGSPIRINSSGELDFVNVTVEAEALNVAGVAGETILTGTTGNFLSSGKVENITTTATFGDLVYISKSGTLTASKPSIGVDGFVSGDFVISVGVIAKNTNSPIAKDLIVNINVEGQL